MHSVALRPLPFSEPDRLVRIWSNHLKANVLFLSVSLPDFVDWRAESRTFTDLAAYNAQRPMVLKAESLQEVVFGSSVTGDLFRVFGVPPAHGRWIDPAECRPGGAQVAVISFALWQRLFGGRADVIGATAVIDDSPVSIGVSATDTATFATIGVVFVIVAAAASILPARRALRVDPAEALRLE